MIIILRFYKRLKTFYFLVKCLYLNIPSMLVRIYFYFMLFYYRKIRFF
jgi:hypothetical protein